MRFDPEDYMRGISYHTALPDLHYPLKFFQIEAFQKPGEKEFEKLKQQVRGKEHEEEKEEKLILCANCRHKITSSEEIIEIKGRHRHIFNNPHGIIFEIGCFSSADGCARQGKPTLEFTWFEGFAWSFAMCSKCHLHMGWHYAGENGFFGLILSHLIQM